MRLRASSAVGSGSDEHSDAETIRLVLDGNTAMFELLMRRYNERVYRAARSIVRDEQEAEDIMQQTYVNAFAHLRQFNGSARFSTWLTRIAIHEALARVRGRGRCEVFDDDRPDGESVDVQQRGPQPRAPGIRRRASHAFSNVPSMRCRKACVKSSCFARSKG